MVKNLSVDVHFNVYSLVSQAFFDNHNPRAKADSPCLTQSSQRRTKIEYRSQESGVRIRKAEGRRTRRENTRIQKTKQESHAETAGSAERIQKKAKGEKLKAES
jgi:hypothetical protein